MQDRKQIVERRHAHLHQLGGLCPPMPVKVNLEYQTSKTRKGGVTNFFMPRTVMNANCSSEQENGENVV